MFVSSTRVRTRRWFYIYMTLSSHFPTRETTVCHSDISKGVKHHQFEVRTVEGYHTWNHEPPSSTHLTSFCFPRRNFPFFRLSVSFLSIKISFMFVNKAEAKAPRSTLDFSRIFLSFSLSSRDQRRQLNFRLSQKVVWAIFCQEVERKGDDDVDSKESTVTTQNI